MWYSKPWAPLAAFLILLVVGGYALYGVAQSGKDTLYKSQLQACERGNALREESNRRVAAHNADRDTLQEFLIAAREARRAAYARSHEASDANAAADYSRLIKQLDAVKFYPVKVVDCQTAIAKP